MSKWMIGCVGLAMAVMGCGGSANTASGGMSTMSSGGTDSVVTFHNRSNYAIYHLFLSEVSKNTWGPDQLGTEVIQAGGDFTLHGIPCNSYDIKLVDQDGDTCVVSDEAICAEQSGYNITNDALLSCQGWTAATGAHKK